MAISKVVYNNKTLIDLTSDTVDVGNLLKGVTAHDKQGNPVIGECDYDTNTQDATAVAAEILSGKTAYNKGSKITGTMPNVGAEHSTFTDAKAYVSISRGYHDGTGTVSLSTEEENKFIPANIRQGVTLLGVEGSMTGNEGVNSQANKTVTPSATQQTITPDSGYTHLSQVTVKAIPYNESTNSAGGKTVTIG